MNRFEGGIQTARRDVFREVILQTHFSSSTDWLPKPCNLGAHMKCSLRETQCRPTKIDEPLISFAAQLSFFVSL